MPGYFLRNFIMCFLKIVQNNIREFKKCVDLKI